MINLIDQYMQTGDKSLLKQLEFKYDIVMQVQMLVEKLPLISKLTEADKRVLHICSVCDMHLLLVKWLYDNLQHEQPEEDFTGTLVAEFIYAECKPEAILKLVLDVYSYLTNGRLNSIYQYLKERSKDEIEQVIIYILKYDSGLKYFNYGLLLEHPVYSLIRHLKKFHEAALASPSTTNFLSEICIAFENRIVLIAGSGTKNQEFDIYLKLAEIFPERHTERTILAAKQSLEWHRSPGHTAIWLIETYADRYLPEVLSSLNSEWDPYDYRRIMITSINTLGKAAEPVVLRCLKTKYDEINLLALKHLISFENEEYSNIIRNHLLDGFNNTDLKIAAQYITLAGTWNLYSFEDQLWPLLQHRSKQIRVAAAGSLAKLGESAIDNAAKLLQNKKADVRLTACIILTEINTDNSIRILEQHFETEQDDRVRLTIMESLQDRWQAEGKKLSREEVESRIASSKPRLRWPPVAWIENISLSGLKYNDGDPVPVDIMKYLICRQAGSQEIEPLYELQPLYELIDKSTSGDFALVLLSEYFANGADTKSKWAMVVAGTLGDDRIVRALTTSINKWADAGRGKLAEYAVQALALPKTDRALLAIDTLSMRYRTKVKNIGAAAVEAFASAAHALGVSPDELGDRVIPSLGFEPGKPREIVIADKTIRVRVSTNFKLEYFDLDKNKRITSLPSGTPDDLKSEFKELGSLLREVSKAQTRRLEALMVQQRRWSVDAWSALFLSNPIMIPFGVRLVWGAYNENGELITTFRTLEDQTLTDYKDDTIDLPTDSTIGIIHPLELDNELRQQWNTHLSDYEIEPPFDQMERPVISVPSDQKSKKFIADWDKHTMNGMSFKGRADRLGWRRGAAVDGIIPVYIKSFPKADIDAFINLEDMPPAVDLYSEITLGTTYFVQSGTVKSSSYLFDGPTDADDPRLIPFDQVNPIVFSEVSGDLKKIALGKQNSTVEE